MKLEQASRQLNGQWHSPTSHYNPSCFLSYGMLSAWLFGLRSNQSNIGSVIFHFLGPFDPIWGFFVSSEKFGSYWIHLSCRVLFYFFSVRDQIRVVSSAVISYHHQISQPTLYFCSYKITSLLCYIPITFSKAAICLSWVLGC